ncbi:beta-lactamase hydrolase domain-containing protein [Pseudomonas sp. W5-01]|uniref:beta-lactamase hydrolase domain-containing protein n=1 Tax=Pseudomonas sp. W5-01 TaxID=3097454 RepID=UPI00397DDFAD
MEYVVKRIDSLFSVSGQLTPDDLPDVKAKGFATLICNRPDHEGGADQPDHLTMERSALASGLVFRYVPILSSGATDEQAHQLATLIEGLPKPILAYCRTGNRSARLYAAATKGASEKPCYDVVVIGGGSAGIAITSSMLKRDASMRVAIVEPCSEHYYQPAWTLVGGGAYSIQDTARPMGSVMPKDAYWIKASVSAFAPHRRVVLLSDGAELGYQQLIVCPGLQLAWEKIEGLEETLGKNGVTSNYRHDLAPYTWELVRSLRSGKVLFTQPPMPIKCAGAPQKAMYLSCDHWRKNGVLESISVEFNLAGPALFGVATFVAPLMKYVETYGAQLAFQSNLVKVDGPGKTAWFEVADGNGNVTRVEKTFDVLHVVPPQQAPDFIRRSELADKAGWLEVDPTTLQHPRYPEVFGVGDVCGTTNAKTAAAARKQVVIVAQNLLALRKGAELPGRYDGYGSCPLTVENGKVILAEFGYGGKLLPTFPMDPTIPRKSAWFLKARLLPWFYWNGMLKGREWFTDCSSK